MVEEGSEIRKNCESRKGGQQKEGGQTKEKGGWVVINVIDLAEKQINLVESNKW